MTTKQAEEQYLNEHLEACRGRKWVVFNPLNVDVKTLPVIYGFNNGGGSGMLSAVAIAEDGKCLAGHFCSAEGYMLHDLGIIEGSREDRHTNSYKVHYPNGYRMEFVSSDAMAGHEKLHVAFKLNDEDKS